MSSNKQYGLQLSKKNVQNMVQKHSAFGDDDSDKSDSGGNDWLKKSRRDVAQSVAKRQSKVEIQKALEQDATVYQYDEVYDQMEQQRHSKTQKDKERKPRYIQKLLATAEKRKIENERRVERQVQKERDAEGEEFKDKETFVTSAYKKKLEEFAKLDAEQQRQDMLEEIGDVTKQQDISGFYRHLYETTLSPKEEKNSAPSKEKPKSSGDPKKDKEKDKRQYRKRKDSESSTDKNKDADTDTSSSSSSSSSGESDSEDEKSSESETEDPKRIRLNEYATKDDPAPPPEKPTEKVKEKEKPAPNTAPAAPEPIPVITKEVESINIWEKRTVGVVFDAALKRYLERKAARLAFVQ